MDTDTAFAEWVDGNPYSKWTDDDVDILTRGGDGGLGKHSQS